MNTPPDPLDPLLDAWGRAPAQEALSPEVWRRVSQARPRQSKAARAPWWNALEVVFGRASFAAAFVVACVLLGLFLAEVRVSHLRTDRDRQLAESYLRLIDPLLVDSSRSQHHAGS